MINEASCIFCKIIAKEIPTQIIAESEDILVIKDRAPKAPIHYLILPKIHKTDISHFTEADRKVASSMLLMAGELGKKAGAFRLIANNGASVGQSVFHSHIHFLAGASMADF